MKIIKTIETPEFDSISPKACVNGKVRRLSRIVASVYDNMLRPHGLQGSQLTILFVIGKRVSIPQKAICDALYFDQSTMSRDIAKLVKCEAPKKRGIYKKNRVVA